MTDSGSYPPPYTPPGGTPLTDLQVDINAIDDDEDFQSQRGRWSPEHLTPAQQKENAIYIRTGEDIAAAAASGRKSAKRQGVYNQTRAEYDAEAGNQSLPHPDDLHSPTQAYAPGPVTMEALHFIRPNARPNPNLGDQFSHINTDEQ